MCDLSGFSVSSCSPSNTTESKRETQPDSFGESSVGEVLVDNNSRSNKMCDLSGFSVSSCSPSNTTETKREIQPNPGRSHTSLFAESQDDDSLKDAENQCQVSMDASASVSIFSRWLGE